MMAAMIRTVNTPITFSSVETYFKRSGLAIAEVLPGDDVTALAEDPLAGLE
jgi:hypothetical protein